MLLILKLSPFRRSVTIDYARFIHENVAHLSRFKFPLSNDINGISGEMMQSYAEKNYSVTSISKASIVLSVFVIRSYSF